MLRISFVDTPHDRILRLEGTLVSAWVEELRNVWRRASVEPGKLDLKVDLSDVSFVSSDGENLLLEMMSEGAKFEGGGVYIRHLMNELKSQCETLREAPCRR